jgi:hypothetical protein
MKIPTKMLKIANDSGGLILAVEDYHELNDPNLFTVLKQATCKEWKMIGLGFVSPCYIGYYYQGENPQVLKDLMAEMEKLNENL